MLAGLTLFSIMFLSQFLAHFVFLKVIYGSSLYINGLICTFDIVNSPFVVYYNHAQKNSYQATIKQPFIYSGQNMPFNIKNIYSCIFNCVK